MPSVSAIVPNPLRPLPVLAQGEAATAFSTAVWLPVLAGLLLLFVPAYLDVARSVWAGERYVQGPLLVVLWLWLLWRECRHIRPVAASAAKSTWGWVLIALGAVCYAVGRSQQVLQLEVGAQLLLLPGAAWLLLGPAAVKRLWFAWVFLLFLVPLPGSLIDSLLVPLKELTSAAVTHGLFAVGLPIARDGVVIYAGRYQLFIADACSGLNQLVALAGIGAVYVYIGGHRQRAINLCLLAAIVPVALTANFLRVTLLVLTTYYGGDGVGQSLHDAAGWFEMLFAFGTFFLLDHLMRRWSAEP